MTQIQLKPVINPGIHANRPQIVFHCIRIDGHERTAVNGFEVKRNFVGNAVVDAQACKHYQVDGISTHGAFGLVCFFFAVVIFKFIKIIINLNLIYYVFKKI